MGKTQKTHPTYYTIHQFLQLKNVCTILGKDYKLTCEQEFRLQKVLKILTKYQISDCEWSVVIANMIKYNLTNYIGRISRLLVIIKHRPRYLPLEYTLKYGKREGLQRYNEITKKRLINLPSRIQHWINKGYTENDAKEQVKQYNQRAAICSQKKLKNTSKYTIRSTEYWINKGLSIDEARQKVKEIQGTNSLNRYIQKYGEIEGSKKFINRQVKWLETLHNLPKDQQQLITLKKGHSIQSYMARGYSLQQAQELSYEYYKHRNNYSKISQDCFEQLEKRISGEFYYKNKNYEYQINGKNVDFYDKQRKVVIEFYGNYWHCDKRLYKENFLRYNTYAKEIWEQDDKRLQIILNSEEVDSIIIIWENAFRENPSLCIEQLIRLMEKENGTNCISKRIETVG